MKNINKTKLILKIISLFLGIFVWMYVVSSGEVELSQEVKIALEIPKNWAVKNKTPKEVIYRIKGPRIFARKFMAKKKTITILQKDYYKPNKKSFSINLEKLRLKLPFGLELVNISPRQFKLELEKSFSKTVMISPEFSPGILEQYRVQKLVLNPKKVNISGPKTLVRKIKKIKTKEIDALNIGVNKEVKIPLVSPDERIKLSHQKVIASMILASKTKTRKFENIPIIFQSMELIKYASQKNISIKLVGNEDLIDNLKIESIQVVAAVPKSKKGKGEFTIELITELPQGIKVLEIKPKTINVKVE